MAAILDAILHLWCYVKPLKIGGFENNIVFTIFT